MNSSDVLQRMKDINGCLDRCDSLMRVLKSGTVAGVIGSSISTLLYLTPYSNNNLTAVTYTVAGISILGSMIINHLSYDFQDILDDLQDEYDESLVNERKNESFMDRITRYTK